jgi:hypothetical protein
MTGDLAAYTSPGSSDAVGDDDTEGCLCVVAGYASKNGLIGAVTAEAAQRVMMSPALGDYLQLWYVDLGPRPGPDADRTNPVRRIAAALMTVQEMAGRNHFALIVIAKAATTIEGLLSSCAAEPFLASLRMRCTGIASSDDRDAGGDRADITTSPTGSWRSESELIDALHQRCEELPRYFAGRREPGLTRTEVAALRQARADRAAGRDDQDNSADTADADQVEIPVPDILGEASEPAEAEPDEVPVPDVPGKASEGADANPSSAATATVGVADSADSADSASAGSQTGSPAASKAARWLPRIPLRRRKRAAAAEDPGDVPEEQSPTAMGLAYLLMVSDRDPTADPGLGLDRLQAALLDVDRRLATQPDCDYQIRVFQGNDGRIHSEPRTADRTVRRAMKRSIWTEDFSAVLKVIRGSLRQDIESVQSLATAKGLTLAPPVIIIFTADPPMAELGAAAVLGDIATEARIVWVVPRRLEGLVSPAFSEEHGVVVLGEHLAVADDILDLLRGDVGPERSDDPSAADSGQPESD